ncbi:MAG: hypothetical protein QM711_16120 [Micropruina sp.]
MTSCPVAASGSSNSDRFWREPRRTSPDASGIGRQFANRGLVGHLDGG